jgi:hypothetical protein
MSNANNPRAVRLEGDDLDRANTHFANAVRELKALSKVVSQALGQDSDRGFTSVVVAHPTSTAENQPVDLTVTTFGEGTICLGFRSGPSP